MGGTSKSILPVLGMAAGAGLAFATGGASVPLTTILTGAGLGMTAGSMAGSLLYPENIATSAPPAPPDLTASTSIVDEQAKAEQARLQTENLNLEKKNAEATLEKQRLELETLQKELKDKEAARIAEEQALIQKEEARKKLLSAGATQNYTLLTNPALTPAGGKRTMLGGL